MEPNLDLTQSHMISSDAVHVVASATLPALSLLIFLTLTLTQSQFSSVSCHLPLFASLSMLQSTTFFFFFPLISSQLTIAFHVLVSLCPTTTTTNNNNNYFFLVIFFRDIVFSSHYMYVLWRIKIMA